MNGFYFLLSCYLIVIVGAGIIQEPEVLTCTQNVPCKWAMCSWEPDPSEPSRCEIMENECVCPPATECKPTDIMHPRSTFVSIQYRCLINNRLIRP